MIDFRLSPVPFAVLTVFNFIFSWIWYSPVLFARPWMKALDLDMNRIMSDEEKKKMPFLFLSGLIASALVVYGIMVAVHSLGITSFSGGLAVGLAAWAAFVLTHSLNTLWEGRKVIVLVINNGLYILVYALYGGILAIWN